MTFMDIRVGHTHTSRILAGACPVCGLGHPRLTSSDACLRFRRASNPSDELIAWRGLKAAVAAAGRV